MNDKYARLNRRFDERAALLVKMGFKHRLLHEFGFDAAVFTRPRPSNRKVPDTIQASFVLCADEDVWADRMAYLS